ncbi:hypothetical protein PCC7418_2356 [Halothece sp. PCC 7418]|uniref:hypothetical protein n=1 Tax=Halothece sp. (strain PCC 7418) TaxID=65093 RepID=UPI0002A07383|nr:hypothetical protein [Halothece sp. PCC 7418]AFZ44505.1 hypothetical protein PCC7418_2356 [Halothece sp. PCC 7418]
MNRLLPHFINRAYRKEPISAFILTMGLVNAVIGGVEERWTLLTLGLLVGTSAIALRWWQNYQYRPISQRKTTTRYLKPSETSRPRPLPPLTKMQRSSRRQ